MQSLRRSLVLAVAATLALIGVGLLFVASQPPSSGAGSDALPAIRQPGSVRDSVPADVPLVIFPQANAVVVVELASTPAQRERGLMERTELADGTGMLFVFPSASTSPFWMKNTLVPLSIAFIDDRAIIVDIQDMQPRDETLHFPAAPYRYALEVPQGWFSRARVAVGQRVELPPLPENATP